MSSYEDSDAEDDHGDGCVCEGRLSKPICIQRRQEAAQRPTPVGAAYSSSRQRNLTDLSRRKWNCEVCTLENQPKDLQCVACEAPKPSMPVPKPQKQRRLSKQNTSATSARAVGQTEYEQRRLDKIAENKQMIANLGLDSVADNMKAAGMKNTVKPKKSSKPKKRRLLNRGGKDSEEESSEWQESDDSEYEDYAPKAKRAAVSSPTQSPKAGRRFALNKWDSPPAINPAIPNDESEYSQVLPQCSPLTQDADPPQFSPEGETHTHVLPQGATYVLPQGASDTHVLPQGATHVLPQGATHVLPQGATHVLPQGATHVLPQGATHVLPQGASHTQVSPQGADQTHVLPQGADQTHVLPQGARRTQVLHQDANGRKAPQVLSQSRATKGTTRDYLPSSSVISNPNDHENGCVCRGRLTKEICSLRLAEAREEGLTDPEPAPHQNLPGPPAQIAQSQVQSRAENSKPLSVVSHGEGCVCRGRLTQEVCGKIRQRFNKN